MTTANNRAEDLIDNHAYAVILAGGYGERFWPLSTAGRPKQLLSLLGDKTMLEMAVDRLDGLIPPERVLVLTSADLVEVTREAASGLPPENVVGEPMRRDTAAAVALACALVKARDPQGVFCILTADHVMGDLDLFKATLRAGLNLAATDDVLVTIGLTPTSPSTAFGYVETGEPLDTSSADDGSDTALHDIAFHKVARFVEKPDRETAEQYLATGRFWWNSGMFIWAVESLAASFSKHRPELGAFIEAMVPAVGSPDFQAALAAGFEPLEKISIDYALMEHADNIVMAEGGFAWDDVGSWPEVANHLPADEQGNVSKGDVVMLDSVDNVVLSEGRLTAIIGVSDLVVVQANGVTLVVPKDRAQDVKKIVAQLRQDPKWGDLL